MKIVVDENIPFGAEAFAEAGEVALLPGRSIGRSHLAEASALIVRSVTRVDAALLEGTPVRFVGTCTIGTDHLDVPWLESRGIAWCSAPGCNARSVAEYAVAALAAAHRAGRIDLARAPVVGVVGAGRVGETVARLLEALGLPVLRNDPPRAEREGWTGFVPLDELLGRSALVCAHLPLTRGGSHATAGLLDAPRLRRLPSGALLLNAGRGPTAPSDGLRALLSERADLSLVLDVWDPEPVVPTDIGSAAFLGTPHVAGYSHEGKVEGTRMVRAALAEFADLPSWAVPDTPSAPIAVAPSTTPDSDTWDALCGLVLSAYDILSDSDRMSGILALPDPERGAAFDALRRSYPIRREFGSRPVSEWERLPESTRRIASRIGFRPA